MDEIDYAIKDVFLNNNNKKVKDENIQEFLTSLKTGELVKFALFQPFVDGEYGNLYKVKSMSNKPKKFIIEYIMNNLDMILKCYIKYINNSLLKQLKYVIDNNGKEFVFGSLPITIHFIDILKRFSIAKVEYNKKEDSLKIFMPKEYIEIFKNCLDDKELLEKSKYNTKVYNNAMYMVNTYGIVPFDKLHELFSSQIFKIESDELYHIISTVGLLDEIYIYNYNEETLVCNLEFDNEDLALDFYDNQKMDYKKYSKEEYKKISEITYVEKLKSYKKFTIFLCRNYDGISKDLDYIRDFFVYDYISFAQTSIENAERAFRNNIVKFIELDDNDLDQLSKLMKNIFDEYPKWSKRGNI